MPEPAPPNYCPRCQGPVLPESLGGHCPRCLTQVALDVPDAFLEDSPFGGTERLPRRFGDFELEALIGRGGMGVVYRARQLSLNREVAIKLLPGGEFASPEFRKRFHAEARTAASLTHPHIVTIHDVGEHEGLPYFAMEYVAGHTLADVIRSGAVPPQTAARLCRDIARAVHFAHEHGVLHRDLKPANVLLDAFDHPRLVDFGLASFLSANPELTRPDQTLGTPAYMPPEQVAGNHGQIGRGSDIYALGAILYHLLTGRPAFEGGTLPQILRQIESEEPVPPRRLNPGIPQDLQTICLKCLEKDPQKRYRDAFNFAEELDRFLRSEPIHARPRSALGKGWLWCRRRPAIAIALASIALLLLLTAAGTSIAAWRIRLAQQNENQQRRVAEAANQQLRQANAELARTVHLIELQTVENLFEANDASPAVAHLAAILRSAPSNTVAASRLVSALVHRNWALPTRTLHHGYHVSGVHFSPDGNWLLTTSRDRTARLQRADTGAPMHRLQHTAPVLEGAFSAESDLFATGAEDGSARLWQTADGTAATPWLNHTGRVVHLEFDRSGSRLLVVSESPRAKVWNTRTAALVQELGVDARVITSGCFSPDGERVATATADGCIQLRTTGTETAPVEIRAHTDRILHLAFSPDGKVLASASADHFARLWEASSGLPLSPPLPHRDTVYHVSFDPAGIFLLSTSFDGQARLWNSKTGFPFERTMTHEGGVTYGTFNAGGTLAVTTGLDHAARVWDPRTGLPYCQPLRHFERIVHAAFSPASDRLATASYDHRVQIWDIRPRRAEPTVYSHPGTLSSSQIAPDGSKLLLGTEEGSLLLMQVNTGGITRLQGDRNARINAVRWTHTSDRFIAALSDGTAQLWNSTPSGYQPQQVWHHAGDVLSAEFSRDGSRAVTASRDGTARVWNANTGDPIGSPIRHTKAVRVARFSPDSHYIATGSEDGTAEIWDGDATRRMAGPLRHIDHVLGLDFSPDETRLVTASNDNTARIWETTTGKSIGRPLRHRRTVTQAAFLPDGRRIATASLDLTTRLWDATTGEATTPLMKHDSPVGRMSVSEDGRKLVTGCWNGHVRVWDTDTGMALTEWFQASGAILEVQFTPVGSRIAAISNNAAFLWHLPKIEIPVPEWFGSFAESIANARMSESGSVEQPARALPRPLQADDAEPGRSGFYRELQNWLVADPMNRPPFAF